MVIWLRLSQTGLRFPGSTLDIYKNLTIIADMEFIKTCWYVIGVFTWLPWWFMWNDLFGKGCPDSLDKAFATIGSLIMILLQICLFVGFGVGALLWKIFA
jgi:hypothetical protein